ncbi:MAG: hypothetical protein HF978_08835 [Desulfobacteraceae bacterium]|nr:hypothetical protein [Desulfobacteraceae bacterium]MBC2755638.1 hypothetical protein [Desulfobacteraceae bacterium]
MINAKQPVRTTIFYGLICGLIFLALGLFFERTVFWSAFFRLTIFSCLAAYSFILASWANKKRISVIFPLLFLFFFIFSQNSNSAFLLLCLGMLSWIRSGVCFQNAFSKSLGAEIIFSIGGGALVAYFSPYSTVTWALGIWMFFLVQSLYFIVMTDFVPDEEHVNVDAFEQARMRAEGILKA